MEEERENRTETLPRAALDSQVINKGGVGEGREEVCWVQRLRELIVCRLSLKASSTRPQNKAT